MSNNVSIKSRLVDFFAYCLNAVLLRIVGYVDENGSKRIGLNAVNAKFSDNGAANKLLPVSIISRSLYSEYHKAYPIAEINELKQVLKQQFADKLAIHLISADVNHQRQVVSFIFSSKLAERLPFFCLLLPESLVVHAGLEDDVVQADLGGARWFLYKNGRTFSSQLGSALCASLTSFALIQGVPENTLSVYYDDKSMPSLLLKGLKNLTPKSLYSAVNFAIPTTSQLPWKAISITCIAALVLYFSIVSAYLAAVYPAREAEVAQLNDTVQSVFLKQKQYESVLQQIQEVNDEISKHRSVYPLWLVSRHLLELNVTMQSAELIGHELTIVGNTDNAIQVLSAITELDFVNTASFSQPTRRSRGRETFTIRISLKIEAPYAQ